MSTFAFRLNHLSCIIAFVLAASRIAAADDSLPIALGEVANRGFVDEIAADEQGGWTDQGPDNDLRSLQAGRLLVHGIPFQIIGAPIQDNRAALVLGQASRKVAHDTGEAVRPDADSQGARLDASRRIALVPLRNTRAFRNLYLLHAAANPPDASKPFGYLTVQYADGSRTRHELRDRRDVGNWRDPMPGPNAGIAWESENPTASIGLFVSRFSLEARIPVSITFELAGTGAWMIVGATASDREVKVGVEPRGFTVTQGPEWGPYEHSLDIAPGGVFDFSFLLHAPAGRHGPLRTTPEGHFEFADRPGHRARFWGVNLCFSAQFLEKPEADLLAERLARSGYNTVRFHHFDGILTRGQARSSDLDPAALDQLEYLFAALKRRGIYVNIDLYSSRSFRAEEVESWGVKAGLRSHFKSLVPIVDGAFEAWARFATNLLSHRNPYTGLTWAEDPALIGICPVNENPLFNRVEAPADIAALYAEAFATTGAKGAASSANPAFNRFIHELNLRSDARLAAHLRSLGTRALLTGANYTISQGLVYARDQYDYVDCHSYWDHPKFPVKAWSLPIAFGQGSSIRARAKMPARIMPTRVFGRPFVSTEFNFCRPNRHRMEGALLMPVYASLQDWDGLYNFQYAMSRTMAMEGGVENYFALANDPIGLVGDRIGALLFQRGDISPAKNGLVYAVHPKEAYSALGRLFPGEFSPLGLVARIGSLPGTPAEVMSRARETQNLVAAVAGSTPDAYAPDAELADRLQQDGKLPPGSVSPDQRRYRSDTGEIELDADAGTLRVVTPRSELFVLSPEGDATGAVASIKNGKERAAIAVIALPAAPGEEPLGLAAARRILIAHLADALPQGMRFSHTDRKLLQDWGEGPHLLQRARATVSLQLPEGEWRAWAVDASGARARELPLSRNADRWVLEMDTVSEWGTQLAYELAR